MYTLVINDAEDLCLCKDLLIQILNCDYADADGIKFKDHEGFEILKQIIEIDE